MQQALTLYPVEYGALTQLWAGTSEEGAEFNGKVSFPLRCQLRLLTSINNSNSI